MTENYHKCCCLETFTKDALNQIDNPEETFPARTDLSIDDSIIRVYYFCLIYGRCFYCNNPISLDQDTVNDFKGCQFLPQTSIYFKPRILENYDRRDYIDFSILIFESYHFYTKKYIYEFFNSKSNSILFRISRRLFKHHWKNLCEYTSLELLNYFKTWRKLLKIYSHFSKMFDVEFDFEINEIDDLEYAASYLISLWNGAGCEIGGPKYKQALTSFTKSSLDQNISENSWAAIASDPQREKMYAIYAHCFSLNVSETRLITIVTTTIQKPQQCTLDEDAADLIDLVQLRRHKKTRKRRRGQKKIQNSKPKKQREAKRVFDYHCEEYDDEDYYTVNPKYALDDKNCNYYDDNYDDYNSENNYAVSNSKYNFDDDFYDEYYYNYDDEFSD